MWLKENDSTFADLRRTAGPHRRQLNKRLEAWTDLPEASRVQPIRASGLHPAVVAKLLSRGNGFYHFDSHPANSNSFFVATVRREIWAFLLPAQDSLLVLVTVSVLGEAGRPVREM